MYVVNKVGHVYISYPQTQMIFAVVHEHCLEIEFTHGQLRKGDTNLFRSMMH